MYRIDFRHDLNLLDISWSQLFTAEAVARYGEECKARFRAEGFAPGYLLRMDMRASAVQPQEAVQAFRTHLGDFPKARRIAIVTASAIARLQVKREMRQPYLQIFDDADAALAWLLAPEAIDAQG
ncbi:STAS/SEC14 domain-containing protein [Sphingobium sp. AP49]|uniref:STAS/SEC14 domain-containing protein n=1 Tax=Sphingobium sp. AP49 TaxID=1144307 RepID=UPI00026EC854|nr:STAS/SEC14 domain-containing protein [Sphingobium sp. AP49]WHO37825.1 STAS/SEC14 domain-containing protein [Sphingobium sp. AP49]